MENLKMILSNSDNIPVVGLLVLIVFFVWLWWREA
jgi:hypothetical protein